MRYAISTSVLSLVPEFRRGVVVARNLTNGVGNTDVGALLAFEWDRASQNAQRSNEPHVRIWDDIYRRFGANPERDTPSIQFLLQQATKQKPLRSINTLVDLFNVISLRYGLPCGGDDLDALDPAGIELDRARGDECFASLGKPDRIEHPEVGEVVYVTLPSRRVMCRRWNWRNGAFSKITAGTRNVAINIDAIVPPVSAEVLRNATDELARLTRTHCGGDVSVHFIGADNTSAEV